MNLRKSGKNTFSNIVKKIGDSSSEIIHKPRVGFQIYAVIRN